MLAIATGVLTFVYVCTVPETYAPVLLRRRANKLSETTGQVYKTQIDMKQGPRTLANVLKVALSRPWILLLREPIVIVLSLYQAIIYATLYMCFGKWREDYKSVTIDANVGTSCLSNCLSRRKRLVVRNRWPCFPRRDDRHDLHDSLQHMDQ